MINRKKSQALSHKSGVIILSVLWLVVVLSLFAFSLARKSQAQMQWVRHFSEKIKAKYLAWQGVVLGMEKIYKNPLGKEKVKIDGKVDYFIADEEARLNLNAINKSNMKILLSFLDLLGIEEKQARIISFSLIDWIDLDATPAQEQEGAENQYYQGLDKPYYSKNLPLDSKEELLLVRAITPEIFNSIKNHITIWPKQGALKVNFDTASEIVLRSLARSLTGTATNTSTNDADSLVEKIMEHRAKKENSFYRDTQESMDINDLFLNPKEKSLLLSILAYRMTKSNYFCVHSYGQTRLGIKISIQAVIDKNHFSIISWRRK